MMSVAVGALLDFACQLLTAAADLREIVVCQLAPALLHDPDQPFPVCLHLIPGVLKLCTLDEPSRRA